MLRSGVATRFNIFRVKNFRKICQSLSLLQQLHASDVISGLCQNDSIISELLSCCSPLNADNASWLLLYLGNSDVFVWNDFIRERSLSKNPNDSVLAFVGMLRYGLEPDHFTYPFLLRSASRLFRNDLGKAIHSHVLRNGFVEDRFVANALIHMYGLHKQIDDARKVFDEIPEKNLVSWNSMLDGYVKCRDMNSASSLFDMMVDRDIVSWSCLIDGYVKSKELENAILVFDQMLAAGPNPNEVTMVSVLNACSHMGALGKGRAMHRLIVDNHLPMTLTLRTSLVDMYAKCGAIDDALAAFRGCAKDETDVMIWNSIIGGLATHGLFKQALDLFQEMQWSGIDPDDITYLCLLTACAHGRMVKAAWHYFGCLCEPKIEHYASLVDAMARSGQVDEAFRFLDQMPIDPTPSTLGALLNGCVNHKKMDLAEAVGKKLIDLDPDHDGRYIGLSNVYADFNRWDKVRGLRSTMERRGIKKLPGHSCLEVLGAIHRFNAHEKMHPCIEEINIMLRLITSQLKLDAAHVSAALMET